MPMRKLWQGVILYFWTINFVNGQPQSLIGVFPCNLTPDSIFSIGRCLFKCVTNKYVDEYPVCNGRQGVELCDDKRKCSIGRCLKIPCTCEDIGCSFQCYRSVTICFVENRKNEIELPVTTAATNTSKGLDSSVPNYDFERSNVTFYERAWPSVLPIFLLILFSTILIHYCHRCHKKSGSPSAPAPSAPVAPSPPPPLSSPAPLVVTFASIHSNPFEQHMTPSSLIMQSVIREADPRARRPLGPFLQLRRELNPIPSAPSAELIATPSARSRNNIDADLPPPYHLALQLEEPPPPYTERN